MPLEPWQLEFVKAIEGHRCEGWGWRYDGLESWSNEKIFAQLRALAIDTDAERFRQQAVAAGRVKILDDDWDRQLVEKKKDTGFWLDFPMLAVPVLWDRLAGDLVCPEIIEVRLHRVRKSEKERTPLADVDGIPADLAAVLGLVRAQPSFCRTFSSPLACWISRRVATAGLNSCSRIRQQYWS